MDLRSSDLEFFDFKNSSDEEIKEIQAILKGPGSNGCVELPWDISMSNSVESHPETEGVTEDVVAIDSCLNYSQSSTAQLPAIETFVTLSTTVGPYQNAPYFVSRTIPYLRAYPPIGVPFFACPIPPGTGEANPYGQFVPVTAEKPEAGNESTPNTIQSREKRTDVSEPCPEPAVPLGPSSVPLVPLPPSTFAVAGYPPGLHTLPYPQMAGQTASPAMYYVPVFNHPYGGYLPSPPMLLPETGDKCSSRVVEINTKQAAEADNPGIEPTVDCKPFTEAASNVQPDCQQEGDTLPLAKTTELGSSPSSSEPLGEGSSPNYLQEVWSNCPPEPVAPSLCLQETVVSNDCQPEPVNLQAPEAKVDENSAEECLLKTVPSNNCSSKQVVRAKVPEKVVCDPSRCWADLFKSSGEVNGIDRHTPKQRSTLNKDITNGKVYSMPLNH